MDLALVRRVDGYRSDGIFSSLREDLAEAAWHVATVEHSYVRVDPAVLHSAFAYPTQRYVPKLAPGTFVCQRGKHRLEGMTEDFETFEITGVVGHSGLVFHWGNFNRSSKGCICTGEREVVGPEDYDKKDGLDHMVTNSRKTFASFMALQVGVDRFNLRVEP